MRILIKNDVYDIASRLKNVDRDYVVYYDKRKKEFIVYCGKVFAFIIGKRLDNRAIKIAYSSHIRNAHKILREIIERNAKLEEKEMLDVQGKSMQTFQELIDYADSKGDINFDNINKTKWL